MIHPLVLEINTRCWLQELGDRLGVPVTLANVPDDEFAAWVDLGFTHLWLLGVWTTGPVSRQRALDSAALAEELDRLLPGWQPRDVGGSPFAVASYSVPKALGGEAGLQTFRRRLHERGLKLILDFVPNHVGLDHPWLKEHPDRFVQSPQCLPGTFESGSPRGTAWIAHGKDPNFPPWVDTAQLDYRKPETQRAIAEALESVAARCDGVRCDMAMLELRDVFLAQWQAFPMDGPEAEGEFWDHAIRRIRRTSPELLLLAEVYWDLEARLQALGFNYTYDKRLYDYLLRQNRGEVRRHLQGVGPAFLTASAHFLENHDEPRVAGVLPLPEHRTAALLALGLPGLRLLHEGQLDGARHRVPVQLVRRPQEPVDQEIAAFYEQVLRAVRETAVGRGQGELLPTRSAWPGNASEQDIGVVQWQETPKAFDLVVVNLAPHRSQCYVSLTVPGLSEHNWYMRDLLGSESYQRFGDDLQSQGLYLDLVPHAAQLFHFSPVS